jgi:hypothetical protein
VGVGRRNGFVPLQLLDEDIGSGCVVMAEDRPLLRLNVAKVVLSLFAAEVCTVAIISDGKDTAADRDARLRPVLRGRRQSAPPAECGRALPLSSNFSVELCSHTELSPPLGGGVRHGPTRFVPATPLKRLNTHGLAGSGTWGPGLAMRNLARNTSRKISVDPIHFSIVVVTSTGFGSVLPPIGFGLFYCQRHRRCTHGPFDRSDNAVCGLSVRGAFARHPISLDTARSSSPFLTAN